MKRISIAVAVVALVFAGLALASTKHYSGTFTDDQCGSSPQMKCTFTFNGVVKDGKVKTVSKYLETGIPLTCDEGTFVLNSDGNANPDMKVKKHKFSGHFVTTDNERFIDTSGKFTNGDRKVSGTYRLHGDFPGQATNCDTGKLAFAGGR